MCLKKTPSNEKIIGLINFELRKTIKKHVNKKMLYMYQKTPKFCVLSLLTYRLSIMGVLLFPFLAGALTGNFFIIL